MNHLFLFLSIGLVVSCAPMSSPRHPGPPPESRPPPVVHPSQELTPERNASNVLLEQGREALSAGRYDYASDRFQEAIGVDPSNGAAYYELADAKFRSGEYGDVTGFLDKAESLLMDQPEWLDKIEQLRQEVQLQKP